MKNLYLRYLKQKEKRNFRLFILFGNVRDFKIFSYSTGPDKIPNNKTSTSKQNNLEKVNNSPLITDGSILKSNEQTKSQQRTFKILKSSHKDKIEPSLKIIKGNIENDLNEQSKTAILKEKRLITISLAPPQLIRQWAETKLPNGKVVGQVMNANTLHYNTFLPMKGGLFCERIFGPIKDFQCACGIQKAKPSSVNNSLKNTFLKDQETSLLSENRRLFCPKCDVEYTWSDKRRVQQGYIQLASPVTHIWYLKSSPSTISILLGMNKADAEAVTYCIDTLTLDLALQTGRYIDSSDQLQNFLKLNRNNENLKPKNIYIQVNKNKIYLKPKYIDWWRKRDKSKSFFKEHQINLKNNSKIVIKNKFKQNSFLKFPIYNLMKSVSETILSNLEKSFFKTSFYKRKIMYLVKSKKHSPYNLVFLLKGNKSGNLFPFKKSGISNSNKKEFPRHNINNKKLTKNRFLDDIKTFRTTSNLISHNSVVSLEMTNGISAGGPILLNNIYSLSHRYQWNSDVKVQKFLSYIWPSNDLRAIPISNYKHRIVNSIFAQQYAIAGGGILAKLLSECNFQEYHRIIYQLEARIPNLINKLRNVTTKKEKKELRELLKIALLRIEFYKTAFQPKSLDTLDSLLKLKDTSSLKKNNTKLNPVPNESKKQKSALKKISEKSLKSFLNPKKNKAHPRRLDKGLHSYSSFLFNKKNKSILNSVNRTNNKNLKVTSFSIEWMFISVLPVLPPALRPIIKMQDQIISTDLNRLYQKIIYRNERVKKFMKDSATRNSSPMLFAQKLLQESVDNLIENGKSGTKPETDKKGRPLKSLGELLKGKQGRFRQNLLGKRVDYSGRSVIVVGPRLKLSECGLPKEMALELFRPFLIKEIVINGAAKTVIGAKKLIKTDPVQTTFFLKRVLEQNVVLLNRAPTLHRVGFQAFRPKLIEGRAILIHPLVCPAFNADFDGDQMAVHVPLTYEARAEALKFLLSPHNIMSPATGEPLAQPSQDMVLGCYYLTTFLNKKKKDLPIKDFFFFSALKKLNKKIYFSNFDEVLFAYQKNLVSLHTKIWVKYDGLIQMDKNDKYMKKEIRIYPTGQNMHINSNLAIVLDSNLQKINQIVLTTPGRILFNFLIYKKCY